VGRCTADTHHATWTLDSLTRGTRADGSTSPVRSCSRTCSLEAHGCRGPETRALAPRAATRGESKRPQRATHLPVEQLAADGADAFEAEERHRHGEDGADVDGEQCQGQPSDVQKPPLRPSPPQRLSQSRLVITQRGLSDPTVPSRRGASATGGSLRAPPVSSTRSRLSGSTHTSPMHTLPQPQEAARCNPQHASSSHGEFRWALLSTTQPRPEHTKRGFPLPENDGRRACLVWEWQK
jgi:hypothetical protein